MAARNFMKLIGTRNHFPIFEKERANICGNLATAWFVEVSIYINDRFGSHWLNKIQNGYRKVPLAHGKS